eukprot:TRINITY_DN443_c0_g1_i19.p2 TRINITY_DN443_c0_g1~~TRINITY_DN443_c0_g1_i19.p2  ORF type:complete len:100 (-),score=26.87 TRINITY_DN443_c0_g1_i19:11-310(-)
MCIRDRYQRRVRDQRTEQHASSWWRPSMLLALPEPFPAHRARGRERVFREVRVDQGLSLIHISEPTRLLSISYAVFCLKKKKKKNQEEKHRETTINTKK